MAVGDLYTLTTISSFLGQTCVNVYCYVVSELVGDVGEGAQRLADSWWLKFWGTATEGFQTSLFSDELRGDIIQVQNLFASGDYHERLEGFPTGSNAGDPMPPFNAYGLRTTRTNGNIRRGQKRFPGVVETAQVSGELVSTALTQLTTLGQELTEELTYELEGDSITFSPVTVKRVPYVTEGGNDAYRWPETPLEAVYTQIVDWQPNPNVTSQVSRKIGRGI